MFTILFFWYVWLVFSLRHRLVGLVVEASASRERETQDRSLVFPDRDGLAGLVVKPFASRAEDLGFESRLHRDLSGSSHTSDLKLQWLPCQAPGVVGSLLELLGVSILRLGEMESLISNLCLSVAAPTLV